jgi:hypothetical protein
VVKLILLISKGIIRDQRSRRTVMFYGTLTALIVLFVGSTVLDRWLRDRPFAFVVFWAACAWITILCVLLALLDLLLVRAVVRRERRRIEQEYLKAHPRSDAVDVNAPGGGAGTPASKSQQVSDDDDSPAS